MRRDVSLLAAALVAAACAAIFVIVGEWHFGLAGFEPIAQLWTIWSVSAAVLTLSTQLWVIGGGLVEPRRRWWVMPALAVLAICALVFLGSYRYRLSLFSAEGFVWPLIAACIPAGGVIVGLCRGRWAAADRFDGVAWVLGMENVLRVIPALLAVWLGLSNRWFGAALLFGYAAAAYWPRGIPVAVPDKARRSATNTTFVASAVAGLFSHVTLSAGPIVLAIGGGTDAESSAVFLALFALRVPVVLLQGFLPRSSLYFNQIAAASHPSRLGDIQLKLGMAAFGLALIMAALGAVVFGPTVGFVFGDEARLSTINYATSAAAGTLGAAVLVGVTALAAQQRSLLLTAGWILPVSMAGVFLATRATPQPGDIFGSMLFIEAVMVVLFLLLPSALERRARGDRGLGNPTGGPVESCAK